MKSLVLSTAVIAAASSLSAAVISVDFVANGGGYSFHEDPTNIASYGGVVWNLNQENAGIVPVIGSQWNASQISETFTASGTGLRDNTGNATSMGFSATGGYRYYAGSCNVDTGDFAELLAMD